MVDAPQAATVDPSLLVPNTANFINPAYATPQQRQQLYDYANALMKPQTVNNWESGVGEMARALMGGYLSHQADVQSQASRAYDQQAATAVAGGAYSPASISGGGAAPSASGATQGGSPSAGAAPAGPNDVMAYTAAAAQARGIDPKVATAFIGGESSGSPTAVGDGGSSFGPAQLHYGGISKTAPKPGLGDAFTAATGLDARDPNNWRQTVDFALDNAKAHGWSAWATTRDKLGLNNFSGIGAPPSGSAPAVQAISNAAPIPGSPTVPANVRDMANALIGPSDASAPPSGGRPVQVAQNGNGLPVSAGAIGAFLADPNLPDGVKQQTMGMIAPRTMTDATGNTSISYQNQPPGAPIFRGGVMGAPIHGVPQVIGGAPGAPTSTLAIPSVAGAPAASSPPAAGAGPPTPSIPGSAPAGGVGAAILGPNSPIGSIVHQEQNNAAQGNVITQKAAANQARFQAAQQAGPALLAASYPLRQLQSVLAKNGGQLPTGEGAQGVMNGASFGNMISTMLGHPLATEDSTLTQMQLLKKYGTQIATSLVGHPTDLGLQTAENVSPSLALTPAANMHLVDNYVRLNQLAQKKAAFEHDYYLSHGQGPDAYDNFTADWTKAISGKNAIPLSKYGRPVTLRSGQKGVYVPSTDPSGFSLFGADDPALQ